MIIRHAYLVATFVTLLFLSGSASAITVSGTAQPDIPSGQFMSLTMTINDAKTTFELTGPDYSWFAFGFDTTTMLGYSLIVEGTDDDRTAIEQNLEGVGSPGDPQATQNIDIVDIFHDELSDLTTIVIERMNNTGDIDDPIFSPSMTSLAIIGAYDSFSSPAAPNPVLTYHGRDGRGFGTIDFSVVPEPTGMALAAIASVMVLLGPNRRRR